LRSLEKIFPFNNKNDKSFSLEDIKAQPTLDEFSFSGKEDFNFICKLCVLPLEFVRKFQH